MIRLYLTDDHQQITDGLQEYLQKYPGFEIVGIAQTGGQVLADLENLRVDILVLDILLPDMTGKQVFDQLKKDRPKVLVSSMEKGIYYIRYFIEHGAEGYIVKETGFDELHKAINIIAQGGSFFSESVQQAYNLNKKIVFPTLTRSEMRIFKLKYQGNTTKEIAEQCFVSELTVEKHLSNIFDKYFDRDLLITDKKRTHYNLQKLVQIFHESGYIYEITGILP